MIKKTILVITDGIGYNPNSEFNAFAKAKKPTFDFLFKNSAHSLLKTSGLAVGLPEGQMGNSEVGHMTIGSGRILYQNLVKIDKSIEDKSIFENEILKKLFSKCKRAHIIGLYSDGGVHSHLRHFDAIYNMAVKNGCDTFAHLITDGRDVSPTSALEFVNLASKNMKIASISGRFYAMDRDKRWDRVKKAYDVMKNNENLLNINPAEYIKQSYNEEIFDEFITPASFENFGGIKEDDAIVFINFRNDRARELISAFGLEEFEHFQRENVVKNIVTMTNYDDNFEFEILFNNEDIKDTLAEVISKANLSQLHTAETEKYAHVTFFFNGGKEEPVLGESRVLIPSPKVKTYDECPQMSAYEVCDAVLKGIQAKEDFIVVNFANGDMVGHTGVFEAGVKAVEAVDECLGKIIKSAKDNGYNYMQISDHGNCEEMENQNGVLTNHTTYDVFCFVLADGVEKIKNGGLSNVAPSVLKLMGLEIPDCMDEALF